MTGARLAKRAAALALAAAVCAGAPGPRAYAQVAEVLSVPDGISAPAAGASAIGSGRGGVATAALAVASLGAGPTFASAPSAPAATARTFSAAPAAAAAVVPAAVSAVAAAPAAETFAASPANAAAPGAEASAASSVWTAPSAEPAPPSARALRASGWTVRSCADALADGRRLFDLAAARPEREGSALSVPANDNPRSARDETAQPLAPAAAPSNAATRATPPEPKDGKTKLPRSLWGLFIGHDLMTIFGIEMHMISQPFLVTETLKKSTAIMGFVRNVHTSSMGLANLLPMGLLIDKTDFRVLFIGGALLRAALMGLIPLLYVTGHLSFAALVAIVALNPIFQGVMLTADGAARMAFLGSDDKLNKDATATLGKWYSLIDIAMPLAGSAIVAGLVATFGLGGYAAAYGVYAALLLASVPVYWVMIRDPRDHKDMGLAGFGSFLRGTGTFFWALARGLLLSPVALVRLLVKLARAGRPAASAGEPGVGLKERMARALDKYEATQGFSYILRNKTLFTLISVGAVEGFLSDAMPFVILPNFIKDVIGVGPHFAVPLFGGLLATAGGIFGLALAAQSLGHFFASWRMEGEKGDRLIERVGHGRFYRAAAVSSLFFWLMWAVPTLLPHAFWLGLATVVFVQFAMQLFHGPVGIVMAPVVRHEIPDAKLGRVESAFNMVDLLCSAGGALAAGFLLDWFSIATAMAMIAAAITLTGVLEWMVPRWIFPDGVRPAQKDAGQASAARLAPAFA